MWKNHLEVLKLDKSHFWFVSFLCKYDYDTKYFCFKYDVPFGSLGLHNRSINADFLSLMYAWQVFWTRFQLWSSPGIISSGTFEDSKCIMAIYFTNVAIIFDYCKSNETTLWIEGKTFRTTCWNSNWNRDGGHFYNVNSLQMYVYMTPDLNIVRSVIWNVHKLFRKMNM